MTFENLPHAALTLYAVEKRWEDEVRVRVRIHVS